MLQTVFRHAAVPRRFLARRVENLPTSPARLFRAAPLALGVKPRCLSGLVALARGEIRGSANLPGDWVSQDFVPADEYGCRFCPQGVIYVG